MTYRVSPKDVKRGYTPEKARNDRVNHLWSYLVARPLSFYLTPFFYNTGFSADSVTVIGLGILLVALALNIIGGSRYEWFIVAAILINVWVLLDLVDGNIARLQGKESLYGEMLDWMVGEIYHVGTPLAVAVGLYFNPTYANLFPPLLPTWTFLAAGTVDVIAGLLLKVVNWRVRQVLKSPRDADDDERLSRAILIARAFSSFKAPLLLVATLVKGLHLWLLGYAAFNVLAFFVSVRLALRRTRYADFTQGRA